MKVLYGIQATGNGHLGRAKELIPYFKKHFQLDVLLSGNNSQIELNSPVNYRLNGLTYTFGKNGGINWIDTLKRNNFNRFRKEVSSLDLSSYDLVINDFEPVSAWASRSQDVPCIGLSNQAAIFKPGTPRPFSLDFIGKSILKNFAPCSTDLGVHYKSYSQDIFRPIIRQEIKDLEPQSNGYYLVYLPSFSDDRLEHFFKKIDNVHWKIYSREVSKTEHKENISFYPIGGNTFLKDMQFCEGILTHAGFGLTSEAIYLNKKLLVLPMKGQYEQKCNAFCLSQMGINVLKKLDSRAVELVQQWIDNAHYIEMYFPNNSNKIVKRIIKEYINLVDEYQKVATQLEIA